MDRRLGEHANDPTKDIVPGTTTTKPMPGSTKLEREIAEHKRIQENTGGVPARKSDKVANKKDPIGPKRRKEIGLEDPQG